MTQEQDKERAQPVAWRHSRTHCLYETREEVELADGDAFAEPLVATPGTGVEQDAAGRQSESRVLYGDEPITEQSFTPLKVRDDKRCQACIDRRDGFYGSYAPECPVHDDDGNLRAAKRQEGGAA